MIFMKIHWNGADSTKIHPTTALKNSQMITDVSEIEEDIIYNHMFPATTRLPKYRESYLMSAIDKYCAVFEVSYFGKIEFYGNFLLIIRVNIYIISLFFS